MRVLCALALVAACGDDGPASGGPPISFGTIGSLSAPYAHTSNDGTDLFGTIARAREITSDQRARYGGSGPMTREPDHNRDSTCRKAAR